MRQGLVGIALEAARTQSMLDDLLLNRDPEAEDVEDSNEGLEPFVEKAMDLFGISTGWGSSSALKPHLVAVERFFTAEDEDVPTRIKPGPFEWFDLLHRLEAKCWTAYWSAEESESDWLKFMDWWADLPLQDLPGRFRRYGGKFKGDDILIGFLRREIHKLEECQFRGYSSRTGSLLVTYNAQRWKLENVAEAVYEGCAKFGESHSECDIGEQHLHLSQNEHHHHDHHHQEEHHHDEEEQDNHEEKEERHEEEHHEEEEHNEDEEEHHDD